MFCNTDTVPVPGERSLGVSLKEEGNVYRQIALLWPLELHTQEKKMDFKTRSERYNGK